MGDRHLGGCSSREGLAVKITKDEQLAHYKNLVAELEKHLGEVSRGEGIDPEATNAAGRVLSYHHRRQKEYQIRAAEHGEK